MIFNNGAISCLIDLISLVLMLSKPELFLDFILLMALMTVSMSIKSKLNELLEFDAPRYSVNVFSLLPIEFAKSMLTEVK